MNVYFLEIDFRFLFPSVEVLTSILIRSKSLVLTSRVEYPNILIYLFLHTPSHSLKVVTIIIRWKSNHISIIPNDMYLYIYICLYNYPRKDPIFTLVALVGRYWIYSGPTLPYHPMTFFLRVIRISSVTGFVNISASCSFVLIRTIDISPLVT